jgi:hypothetical protein
MPKYLSKKKSETKGTGKSAILSWIGLPQIYYDSLEPEYLIISLLIRIFPIFSLLIEPNFFSFNEDSFK